MSKFIIKTLFMVLALTSIVFAQGAYDWETSSNGYSSGPSGEELIVIFVVVGLLFLVGIAISIAVILMYQSCYKRIPPQHRLMSPGLTWLLLIPFFNIVWNFFVVINLSKSYQNYFASANRTEFGTCGHGIGLAYCIAVCAIIIPCIGWIAGLAALVLLILYLVKVMSLKKEVSTLPPDVQMPIGTPGQLANDPPQQ